MIPFNLMTFERAKKKKKRAEPILRYSLLFVIAKRGINLNVDASFTYYAPVYGNRLRNLEREVEEAECGDKAKMNAI